MNIDEIVQKLEPWKARHDALMAQYDALKALAGTPPDCALWAAIFDVWSAYTQAVSEQVGDDGEWLQWYELECDMGRKPMDAKSDTGVTLRVRTLRQLARAISW